MKIVSKYKDYYDSALAYGSDEELVYVRKKSKIAFASLSDPVRDRLAKLRRNLPHISLHISGERYSGYDNMSAPFLLGVCGKIYPVVCLTLKGVDTFAYSYEDVMSFLRKHKLQKELEDFEDARSWLWNSSDDLRSFFSIKFEALSEVFIDNKVPLFLIDFKFSTGVGCIPCDIVVNPQLKEYGFYKKLDPYTIFQEIGMYLDGVLGVTAPDMVGIDDLIMRGKKGFDNTSFKHMPDTRRRKAKKGKIPKNGNRNK